jgi:hypothetical protein
MPTVEQYAMMAAGAYSGASIDNRLPDPTGWTTIVIARPDPLIRWPWNTTRGKPPRFTGPFCKLDEANLASFPRMP